MQLPDRLLQILLLLLWQYICELITGFEKRIENSLIQLTEELLHETQRQTDADVKTYLLSNQRSMRAVCPEPEKNAEGFSHRVFIQKVLWVSSLCHGAAGYFQNFLQFHARLLESLHQTAVGLHVSLPLSGFFHHGLNETHTAQCTFKQDISEMRCLTIYITWSQNGNFKKSFPGSIVPLIFYVNPLSKETYFSFFSVALYRKCFIMIFFVDVFNAYY